MAKVLKNNIFKIKKVCIEAPVSLNFGLKFRQVADLDPPFFDRGNTGFREVNSDNFSSTCKVV